MIGRSRFPLVEMRDRASCGTGFIAESSGIASRRVVTLALTALRRLVHRGARGGDDETGDGTGLMTDLPLDLFLPLAEEAGGSPRQDEDLAVAMAFTSAEDRGELVRAVEKQTAALGMRYLGQRDVPVRTDVLGQLAKSCLPVIVQLFIACPRAEARPVEARLYLVRRRIERELAGRGDTYICSLSSKTIVYKGLLTPRQLERFYLDLAHDRYTAKVAVFHERFATNTLPSWALAQPFRLLGHNGEINTIRGNRLWMKAREREMRSTFWGGDLKDLLPVTDDAFSDSSSVDNVLEFLCHSQIGLARSVMMMIPDPYQGATDISPELRDFFIYHENLMEPWDGPAALVFTDGDVVGAKLDRNALRPLRYTRTRDGLIIMASEAGVVDVADDNLVFNRHLSSGEIFTLALDGGGASTSEEIKQRVATASPYSDLVHAYAELDRRSPDEEFGDFTLPPGGFDQRLRGAFGWNQEDVSRFLLPMTRSGREPVGSMGDDTPPAVLSNSARRLYDYFKQAFAQVTNPPIDPIREKLVTSLFRYLGTEDTVLSGEPSRQAAIRVTGPVLSPREVRHLQQAHDWFPHATVQCHMPPQGDLEERLEEICRECAAAVEKGRRIIFLTDEDLGDDALPIPMPLVASAVHQHLIRERSRSAVALVCIAGEVVSDHHVATLVAMGVSAVYPYLAYELIRETLADRDNWPELMGNYRQAVEKGLLKIMAKMGISSVNGYHGSMNLHALGLSEELLARYFPSISGQLGGIGLERIKQVALDHHRKAFGDKQTKLADLGQFRFRRHGEVHGFSPTSVREIRQLVEARAPGEPDRTRVAHLRDLFAVTSEGPISPEAVEPLSSIVERFGSGAISFGAVSDETHRTLARGFFLVGARSSSGEGGESADRYAPGRRDLGSNCHIKQVASGRFGVTTDYLAAAREIQIKMAQGAKPGEGGQLPGHKVTVEIASARSTTPGVPLISPPPHHDIYSIEDLAQLIWDLKEVNPRCLVSVKLVAQPGIGTIACGVVKGGADVVLVSGGDGGTGASPLGSLKHTGFPWELALPETHQALTAAGLRSRARLRVDGGLKNGRDIVIAALLGAEEYDFGTAALIALGCVMARQCHMNTCPVGIATQDPELTAKFNGTPEQLAEYLRSVGRQVRRQLSEMGSKSLDSIIGRTDLLTQDPERVELIEGRGLDLEAILNPNAPEGLPVNVLRARQGGGRARKSLDEDVLDEVYPEVLSHGQAVVERTVRNTDRSVGTRLAGELAFLFGGGNYRGLIQLRLRGVAGQSLGAFLTDGLELRLRGLANDYVGKGMSGGLISIRVPRKLRETGGAHTVIGNVALYGATAGTLLVGGRAGERFAVRNSGASAVVEGVGNHGCEYMTRGTVLVLGNIGQNFGAGMTGGVAFILADYDDWQSRLNDEYVRADELVAADESLVLRLLNEHVFHCASVAGQTLLDEWKSRKSDFVKIVPLAQDIVDFRAIYNQQVAARMGVLLNE